MASSSGCSPRLLFNLAAWPVSSANQTTGDLASRIPDKYDLEVHRYPSIQEQRVETVGLGVFFTPAPRTRKLTAKRLARMQERRVRPQVQELSPSSAVSCAEPSCTTNSLLPSFSSSSSLNDCSLPSTFVDRLRSSRLLCLSLYFVFNLTLTLYNKVVLVDFPFPYTLTAFHALAGTIGGSVLAKQGLYVPAKLTSSETLALLAFSLLYSTNIIVSNTSLHLVTVAFHQVIRAATPILTIVFCSVFFGQRCSSAKLVSLAPVVVGVCLATYGDYYFTAWGFCLTLLGTALAALKTIYTNILQTSPLTAKGRKPTVAQLQPLMSLPKLHPLDLLHLLSPLAFVQCVSLAYASGELEHVHQYAIAHMTSRSFFKLCMNGLLAFGLNVVSFEANKRVGALGMTVAANVKQVLTILFAMFIFNLSMTSTNGVGILLTLVGGAWFARVEWNEKQEVASTRNS